MAILDNIDKSNWLKVFSACLGKMIFTRYSSLDLKRPAVIPGCGDGIT